MTVFKRTGEQVTDPALAGLSIGDLRFNGFPVTKDFEDLITDVTVERSMEEPSTVTIAVHDPGRILQSAGALDEKADLDIGDQAFRLVRVSKTGDAFTLTCEDRDVARLRLVKKPRKAERGKVTRSQFVRSCVLETAGISYWDPNVDRVQQIAAPDTPLGTRTVTAAGASSRSGGFAPDATVRVKGAQADSSQLRELATALQVAEREKANPLAVLAMVCAGTAESAFRDVPNAAGSPYGGVFQARKDRGLSTAQQAFFFLRGGMGFQAGGAIALSKTVSDPGEIATRVEASGKAPGFYGRYKDEARQTIAAFTGQTSSDTDSTSTTTTSLKAYEFTRGTDQGRESTWDMAKRLGDEVGKRRFLVDHEFVFAFDRDLMLQKPAATITELRDGVDFIDYEYDIGRKVESATVACRAAAWAARPGDVVSVQDAGRGSGRWLVARVAGSLFSVERTIELTRPQKGLREPSAETTTNTTTAPTATVGTGGTTSGTVKAGGPWRAPAGGAASFRGPKADLLNNLAGIAQNTYSLTITATTNGNHVSRSNHFAGRAFDSSGSEANMRAFATYAKSLAPQLLELIHNPGFGVKNGAVVDGAVVFSDVWAGHRGHVHLAA